jgi:uncharacterized protein (TIRG00374 family)
MIEKDDRMSAETIQFARKFNFRRALTLFILGTLTVLAILKLSGFQASWERFRALNPRYIVAAFLVYHLSFIIRALRWKLLLRALDHRLSAASLYIYLLVGWFISAVVPARAGDVARGYLLKSDRQIPLRKGLGSIFVERGLDGIVIMSCSVIFSFFILSLGLPKWILTLYQVTFSVLIVLLLCLFLVPKLEHKARAVFSASRYRKLVVFPFRLIENVRLIAKKPAWTFLALLLTIVIWFCDAFVTYLVLLGLDYPLPLPWVAFVSFTVNLVATVPITPGAVGQIDAVQFSLFSVIGMAREFTGVTILISRFICYWSFLLISGLITYATGMVRLLRTSPERNGLVRSSLNSTVTENRWEETTLTRT